ncbi:VanW family protein [Haliangium sp.]|uniref:VanW family protein n=1 Tax=Haliangium sp. TaxID=2663208 RepID=UPI003D108B74
MQATSANSGSGSLYFGLAAAMLVAGGGLLGGYYLFGEARGFPEAAAAETRSDTPDERDVALARQAAEALIGDDLVLAIGERSTTVRWSELGLAVDPDAISSAARIAAVAGTDLDQVRQALADAGAVPVLLDRTRAGEVLAELKTHYDLAPHDARMDLDAHTIHRERAGLSVDIFAALGSLQAAAQSGAAEVTLDTVDTPPEVTVADLGIDDISHVLASFETRYSPGDRTRNFNLELAASKLNGYVLQPGVEFSFNEIVGPRTEEEGYKIAHVITAGEMVDGLAGGTCQISTTLHGAAFFAGLDILRALPHSRPSTYVTMGLDATVVYPQVDVVLANPYDFPVVIHYKVSGGTARVEILGRERPYDEVIYERKMVERLDFDTVTREEPSMPIGTMTIDQNGFYGYKVEKVRKFVKDGKVVKRDKWNIRYKPVTEYVRNGVNPDPNVLPPKPDKKDKHKRLREPSMDTYRLSQ